MTQKKSVCFPPSTTCLHACILTVVSTTSITASYLSTSHHITSPDTVQSGIRPEGLHPTRASILQGEHDTSELALLRPSQSTIEIGIHSPQLFLITMSSDDDQQAQSPVVMHVDHTGHASEATDHSEQVSHNTKDQQEAQVIASSASEQPSSTLDEPLSIAASFDGESYIQHRSSHEEPATTPEDSDHDGDISLVTSPKIDQSSTSIGTASSSHRRIDSVPLQKYIVTHDAENGLSSAFASTSPTAAIQEEEEEEIDISAQQHPDVADIDTASHPSAVQQHLLGPTPVDKADLNFVDIKLDAPEQPVLSIATTLEPINPLAGSTRTAEQIRRGSVCSQEVRPGKTLSTTEVEQNTVLIASTRDFAAKLTPPPSPDLAEPSSNRSVEGRYRGRRSATNSRAASPACSPSPSPNASRRASIVPSQNPVIEAPADNSRSIAPAPMLLAADEHGNISVVSDVPVSPRTATRTLSRDSEPASAPPTVAITSTSTSPSTATTTQAKPRPSHSSTKVATSLSDEVAASDTAQTSHPSSQPGDTTSPTLAPPNNDTITTTSAGLSDKADQSMAKTRRKSSSASTDPVDSRTRMTTLPAKPKSEELQHRADFERMMMAAKETERKKHLEEEERKRRRQDEQRQALGRWEKEILPSWSRARKDAELEQLWWKGAPPSIRGRVWALAIGNPLMLPRNLLEQMEKKAGAVDELIPPRVLDEIEADVDKTLPSLKLFQKEGPLYGDLVRVCRAFVLVRMEQLKELDVKGDADKAASWHQTASPVVANVELEDQDTDEYERRGIDIYQSGLASLAAVLLINMSINNAFIALLNLLHSKPWLKALYSLLPTIVPASSPNVPAGKTATAHAQAPKEKAIRGFERVFETLLADQMPKVYANLLAHNVALSRVVLRDWVRTLFSRWLDVDTVMRVWDVVLLDESEALIYRVALAVVQTLESRLYVPDAEELESVLRGRNAAALTVWRREKTERGELDVVKSSVASSTPQVSTSRTSNHSASSAPADPLPLDYIYEQYAIQEHHVFTTLEAQTSWWKQSTLQRLLDRELSE